MLWCVKLVVLSRQQPLFLAGLIVRPAGWMRNAQLDLREVTWGSLARQYCFHTSTYCVAHAVITAKLQNRAIGPTRLKQRPTSHCIDFTIAVTPRDCSTAVCRSRSVVRSYARTRQGAGAFPDISEKHGRLSFQGHTSDLQR